MLPYGYDPEAYGGKVWWNEDNPGMRAIWGTQEDYDNHVKNGGSWNEYSEQARKRMAFLKEHKDEIETTVKKSMR